MTKIAAMMVLLLGAFLSQGCIGLGCGVSDRPEASLYVVDAETGEPVSGPTFSEQQSQLTGSCQDPVPGDPTACGSYLFFLSSSVHTVRIAAPGYLPETVTLDMLSSDSVHLAIELRAAK